MATVAKGKGSPSEEKLEARYGIEMPYTISLTLRGVTPLLFNKFADLEGYAVSSVAPKRKPREREVVDYESMVWRTENGELGIPTQNIISALVRAGRFFKSPIANNGGATTTLRESLIATEEYANFGVKEWDCIDFRLARNGDVKRSPRPTWRPRLEEGWRVTANFGVVLPELYGPAKILEIAAKAGIACGIGDGRNIGLGRFVPDGLSHEEGLPW